MPIHNTIARQLLAGAVEAAARSGAALPAECSPAIRESAQIHAAVCYVAEELHDLGASGLRERVLLALSQEATVNSEGVRQLPWGAAVRVGQCEAIADTSGGTRRCILPEGHDGLHQCVGVVS